MDILTDVTHNASLNDQDMESQRQKILRDMDLVEKNDKKVRQ